MNIIIPIILVPVFLGSCSPAVMTLSSSQHVPLLTEKGETRISAGMGTDYAGLQAAYAVSNHLEMMGSVSYGQRFPFLFGNKEATTHGSADRFSGEIGAGYYSRIIPVIPFELLGGIERTSINYVENIAFNPPEYFSSNLTKPFVQADIGIQLFKWVQLALSCRGGYVFFDHYRYYAEVDTNYFKNVPGTFLRTSCPGTFIYEPAIKLKFGAQRLNLILQTGISIPATPVYRNGPSMFYNIGFSYHFLWQDTGNAPIPSRMKSHKLRRIYFPFL